MRYLLLPLFLSASLSFAITYHHDLSDAIVPVKEYAWTKESDPFDEFMITWNGNRPSKGLFKIYVKLFTDEWSSWFLYSEWGSEGQRSFSQSDHTDSVKLYQDGLNVKNGKKAIAFQVKIEAEEEASIDEIYSMHVYLGNSEQPTFDTEIKKPVAVSVSVQGLSQMALPTEHRERLCSPTSTAAVVSYLKKDPIDPLAFAEGAHDKGFDIYGNWVFNAAHASTFLGEDWHCWVERQSNFDNVLDYLKQDTPVIISVKGPLKGSALPYESGHLLVITGFDPMTNEVLCMDPAFDNDEKTIVRYDFNDLMKAWERRGFVSYVFAKKQ
jgi:hypothetical protein